MLSSVELMCVQFGESKKADNPNGAFNGVLIDRYMTNFIFTLLERPHLFNSC